MDAGGTIPGKESVESSLEQRPRTNQETESQKPEATMSATNSLNRVEYSLKQQTKKQEENQLLITYMPILDA